jgi:putative serine protease PepD
MEGRRRTNVRTGPIVAVVVAALLGGVAGGLIVDALRSDDDNSSGGGTSAGACAATTVAERDLPSVVTIKVAGAGGQGTGSGSIIRADGYVLTNNHVIAAAASEGRVEVTFNDGETATAQITGRDPTTDLAVLKVPDSENLHPIAIGDSSETAIGAPVIALGAPLGLSNTVTSGIVSALDRMITVPGEEPARTALLVDAIQTDASINPGNSGGALVDCDGRLIGVPTAGATVPNAAGERSAGSVGIGFAVPIFLAETVADEIIETGHAEHAYVGLRTGLVQGPEGTPAGLRVVAVDPNGPAAQAGIQPGDVITEIEGEPARSGDQLLALTLKQRAGSTIELEVERGGQQRTVTVALTAAPE